MRRPSTSGASSRGACDAGIASQEELLKVGDTAAFARLRKMLPDDACVSTRLALAGAVRGVRWFGLDKALKARLSDEARR